MKNIKIHSLLWYIFLIKSRSNMLHKHELKVELRTGVRVKEINWQPWMLKSSLIIRKWAGEVASCQTLTNGIQTWEVISKTSTSKQLFALQWPSLLWCQLIQWFADIVFVYSLLSPFLPFWQAIGSLRTQALSKLAAQRWQSLMKTDTCKSSSLTFSEVFDLVSV